MGASDGSSSTVINETIDYYKQFYTSAGGQSVTAAVPPLVFGNHDIGGEILLPPGGYCILYTSAASGAAGGSFSFDYEEIAIV